MITRRHFITSFGKGWIAVALVSMGACSSDDSETTAPSVNPSTTARSASTTALAATTVASTGSTGTGSPPTTGGGGWERVDFGFVSAYLFVRDGEAVLVDTGTEGNASLVEDALADLGLGWSGLSTVILTHDHGDHVGSLPAIMDFATDAVAYAGAEDIPGIDSPRTVTAVADGETVFGLEIIATPGHTAGHISVLDPSGTLIAGDALVGDGGRVSGPSSRFSDDLPLANESVVKLAGFDFEVVYFGHGEPVMSAGSAQVSELAADL